MAKQGGGKKTSRVSPRKSGRNVARTKRKTTGKVGKRSAGMNRAVDGLQKNEEISTGKSIQAQRTHNPANFFGDDSIVDGYKSKSIQKKAEPVIQKNVVMRTPETAQPMVQKQGAPDTPKQRSDAIYKAFHAGWFTEDEEGALDQIRGQDTETIRAIRDHYLADHGIYLEKDFASYTSLGQNKEALTLLYPVLSLMDKIRVHTNLGLFGTENESAIMEVLRHASALDIAREEVAGNTQTIIDYIFPLLSWEDNYEARKILQPDRIYDHVVWRIKNAAGTFNDDEVAVYGAITDLPPAERKMLWEKDRSIFSFMSGLVDETNGTTSAGSEMDTVRIMCTGTDAEMYQKAMEMATAGAGTYDEFGAQIIEKVKKAAERERMLEGQLAALMLMPTEGPDAVPKEEIEKLKAELARLGGIKQKLLTASHKDGALDPSSFLGLIAGDFSVAETNSFNQEMGVDEYDRAKQMILSAKASWFLGDDDEQAVWDAFELVKDPELKKKLHKDPDVKSTLESMFNEAELAKAKLFATGSSYEIAVTKLADAGGDFPTTVRILQGMSEADRTLLEEKMPWPYLRYTIDGYSTDKEQEIVRQIMETGYVDPKLTVEWAVTGAGTSEELIDQTFAGMSPDDRFKLRLGYYLVNGGTVTEQFATTEFQAEARSAYNSIEANLAGDMMLDDKLEAIDNMLGQDPTVQEQMTDEGLKMAAEITRLQVTTKGKARTDSPVSAWFTDLFSDTGGVVDDSEVRFNVAYNEFSGSGGMDMLKLAALGQMRDEHREKYKEFVAATRSIADTVSTVAAIIAAVVAAIVFTVGTAGTGGAPAAAGLAAFFSSISTTSVVAGTAAGAITKSLTSELLSGGHSDLWSFEGGAKDFAIGGVEGLMAAMIPGLGNALVGEFGGMIGVTASTLPARMSIATLRGAGTVLSRLGMRESLVAGLEGAIDFGVMGAVSNLTVTALDENAWKQGIWQGIQAMAGALMTGFGTGAIAGFATGGLFRFIQVGVTMKRLPGLIAQMEKAGLVMADLEKLTVDQLKILAQVDNLILRGEVKAADEILAKLEKQVSPDLFAKIKAAFEVSDKEVAGLIARWPKKDLYMIKWVFRDHGFRKFLKQNPNYINASNFDHFSAVARLGNFNALNYTQLITAEQALSKLPPGFLKTMQSFGKSTWELGRYFAIYNNETGFFPIFEKFMQSGNKYGLTRDQAFSIWAYTTNLFYKDLNASLRSFPGPSATTEEITALINSALDRLPSYKGKTIYRAIEISEKELPSFLAKYKEGSMIQWGDFTSAGGKLDGSFIKKGSKNILIQIIHKSGKDISKLADGILFRNMPAPEILMQSGTQLESLSDPIFNKELNKWVITLYEL